MTTQPYDHTGVLASRLDASIANMWTRFHNRGQSATHLSMALSAAKDVRLAAGRLERRLREEVNAEWEKIAAEDADVREDRDE